MKLFLLLYDILWHVLLLPLVLYLLHLSRKNPPYRSDLGQRFGRYSKGFERPIWIHGVSLGETRSAVPLARALLDRGERVLFTHFTPAGRSETLKVFADDIAAGYVRSVWAPLDISWAYSQFIRTFRPKVGLVMEVEIWPRMVFACKAASVPLFMCNAQYAARSLKRDSKWPRVRQKVMRGFSGAFVKSQLQADRFGTVGVPNIEVTGELRFDQGIAPELLAAARSAKPALTDNRFVVNFASVVESEEDFFIDTVRSVLNQSEQKPYFVFVPRAPERFDAVARKLDQAGLDYVRRTKCFDATLSVGSSTDIQGGDILLGDSLGEMYFYLELSDITVIGGGYTPRGSHNIIESIALGKSVIVGPYIWTIEYPVVEALDAGVALQVGPEILTTVLLDPNVPDRNAINAFLDAHTGATAKTINALERWIKIGT